MPGDGASVSLSVLSGSPHLLVSVKDHFHDHLKLLTLSGLKGLMK